MNSTSHARPSTDPQLAAVPAVLLVGGLGTRLRSVVSKTPKALARVGETTILELLIRQLQVQGIRRIILCTGHMADQIERALGDGTHLGVSIVYSREGKPMGTGGALKLAESYISDASTVLVMNGDSLLEADLANLVKSHRLHGELATLAVCPVVDASRFGTVRVDAKNRIVAFQEKTGVADAGLVSAGIYAFRREVFDHISSEPSSLEQDLFPRLVSQGMQAYVVESMFIDIGTPDDYARAQVLAERLEAAANRSFR